MVNDVSRAYFHALCLKPEFVHFCDGDQMARAHVSWKTSRKKLAEVLHRSLEGQQLLHITIINVHVFIIFFEG